MEQTHLRKLELDKVVEMAAQRAVCPEARDRLREEQPGTRPEEVRLQLAQTDALALRLTRNGNPRLSSCVGALDAVRRAGKGGMLSMGELLYVAGALRNFSALDAWFHIEQEEQPRGGPALRKEQDAEPGETQETPPPARQAVLDSLFFAIAPQPQLEHRIRDAILSEEEMADTASDELYALRRKIRQAESSIRDKLDGVVKNPNYTKYLQDALVSIRNGRFVVPVKAEHRNEIGGVIHDVSASGGTLFVEPSAVVEANAKVLQLRNQEQQEIERILGDFSQDVADIAPFFEAGYEAMLEVDRRIAKAELGLAMDGVCPHVNEEMYFWLEGARHPLLDRSKVVPVDIRLGREYDTMVITGPNTGGKTVTLKTAGLLCAMAQLGYLIPARDTASVCVFEHILVDIGDEQSIEQSLSTFSGHMRNITGILAVADAKSLVLLDELGAGTDPAEGAALAVSIIEQLRGTGARIMATTHYAELKMFAIDTEGVQNAGCEFDVDTLRPTYKLIVGVPGRSNAFLIGEKLGIPSGVIENARRHMSSEQRRFESVLTQLEDLKLAMKAQEEEIAALRYAADHQLEQAKEKRDALIRQGEQELAEARRQAKTLADEVQDKAYGLIDEMKRLEKEERVSNARKAQRAREIAKREAGQLSARSQEGAAPTVKNFVPLHEVRVGQEVYVPEMGKHAMVNTLPDKAGNVEVRMGAVRTKLPLAQLAAVPGVSPAGRNGGQPARSTGRVEGAARRTPQMELNLLGMTVDEALMETDQFIDNAVMSGLSTIYLIHGRGTGALRTAIGQHLRRHKNVGKFRLGQYGEGEDGVTVVELK